MKAIVITGSTRGIGLAMARTFLEAGCRVTVSGRGAEPPASIVSGFAAHEGRWQHVPCNVQDPAAVQRLWDEAAVRWGAIDIWINNAGQNAPHRPIHETPVEYVDCIMNTNILGMIYGSQVAARGMLAQGHGAIYSMEGLGSNNMIQPGTVLYGTTKHALTYFMRGLAKELAGSGVIAGRLSPGMMLTDFITRTPDGAPAAIEHDAGFQRIFNILADRPETVAAFFIPRMLANTRNDVRIAWLTGAKSAGRFLMAPFTKRKILD